MLFFFLSFYVKKWYYSEVDNFIEKIYSKICVFWFFTKIVGQSFKLFYILGMS